MIAKPCSKVGKVRSPHSCLNDQRYANASRQGMRLKGNLSTEVKSMPHPSVVTPALTRNSRMWAAMNSVHPGMFVSVSPSISPLVSPSNICQVLMMSSVNRATRESESLGNMVSLRSTASHSVVGLSSGIPAMRKALSVWALVAMGPRLRSFGGLGCHSFPNHEV